MATGGRSARAALTREPLSPRFERWRVVLEPAAERPTSAAEWRGAVVLVDRGTLEVHCRAGGRRRYGSGALLALGCLPVVGLRNPGHVPTVVVAVRRVGSGR